MKTDILKRVNKGTNSQQRLNILREELHHLILQEVDRRGGFKHICFLGGTALRILFGLDRYSEDLDFSTSQKGNHIFDFNALILGVQKAVSAYGFEIEIKKQRAVQTVKSCFFVFSHLLAETGPGFSAKQNLAVKFEVDTNPPAGAQETFSPVTGPRLYKVRHYTLPSLFAGKMHALLFRKYTKGRDLYDFLWYIGKGIKVNGPLLQNATRQTQKKEIVMTASSLREMLRRRLKEVDYKKARQDMSPFVQDMASLNMFEFEIFDAAIEKLELDK